MPTFNMLSLFLTLLQSFVNRSHVLIGSPLLSDVQDTMERESHPAASTANGANRHVANDCSFLIVMFGF